MKRIILPVALIIIAVIIVIRLKINKDINRQKIYRYNKEQVINVQSDTVKTEYIDAEATYTGTFEPMRETKISAELQGKINAVYVDAGSMVKEGQSLIQLDNALLNLQLQAADAQIEGLEADVNRYTVLAHADAIQGVQLEKAELGLKSSKIQRANLLEQINKTTIRAPFDGIVVSKLSEEGAFASPGIPLLQIIDISMLKFTINITEADLILFNNNQTCTVIADIFPDLILTGKISLIGSRGNSANSFPIQIMVKNTENLKIKSGMFGKVILKENKTDKRIIIAASSVIGSSIKPQVYLIKNRKAILQTIIISKRIANKLIIDKGIREGDVIVTGGFINLYDSANVAINTKAK